MTERTAVELVGTGRYTPSKVLTNADFERMVDTSDQWIQERTGIRERHISDDTETVAYMSKIACDQVLEAASLTPLDVDAIILATASPDRLLPSTSCDIQAALGARNAAAFDVAAGCSGYLYALSVAEGMVRAETAVQDYRLHRSRDLHSVW
jgi:3-oxoacyl-[acyl-carrier-protein] synthase-3